MTGGAAAAAVVAAAYLLGAIPSSYLVGKLVFGLDLREHGSGNVGATNALRVLGTKAGIFVLAVDIGKGAAAVLAGTWLVARWQLGDPTFWAILAGTAAMVGHVFTVFLRFKGGKGVATGAGVFLALAPRALGVALALFIFVVALTRYVSLGSILAAAVITPLVALETGRWQHPYVVLAAVAGTLVIVRHRSNVGRLLAGTENKFGAEP